MKPFYLWLSNIILLLTLFLERRLLSNSWIVVSELYLSWGAFCLISLYSGSAPTLLFISPSYQYSSNFLRLNLALTLLSCISLIQSVIVSIRANLFGLGDTVSRHFGFMLRFSQGSSSLLESLIPSSSIVDTESLVYRFCLLLELALL